jgi:hypothetical protein
VRPNSVAHFSLATWWLGWFSLSWRFRGSVFKEAYDVCGFFVGSVGKLLGCWCAVDFVSLCWTVVYWSWCWDTFCYWVSLFNKSTDIKQANSALLSPLYNAELSPPEMRGFLIALQQLTTTIGIMLAYWVAVSLSASSSRRII